MRKCKSALKRLPSKPTIRRWPANCSIDSVFGFMRMFFVSRFGRRQIYLAQWIYSYFRFYISDFGFSDRIDDRTSTARSFNPQSRFQNQDRSSTPILQRMVIVNRRFDYSIFGSMHKMRLGLVRQHRGQRKTGIWIFLRHLQYIDYKFVDLGFA